MSASTIIADILNAIFPCITRCKPWLDNFDKSSLLYCDKKTTYVPCEEAANRIVNALFEANEEGSTLITHIDGIAR